MLLRPDGVDLARWREELSGKGVPMDLARFAASILGQQDCSASKPQCCVLLDCSASDSVAATYPALMRSGLHIVTPNKKFGSGPLAPYRELREFAEHSGRSFMYEATVGAGLPVLSTLHDLLLTGDKVIRIEGILSGTLSYIFNTYKLGMRFSDVVADARAKGYTEPDPRDDLSGLDVARKVVILAREVGIPAELDSMGVQSLVPESLRDATAVGVDDYMARLPQFDEEMASRAAEAAANGEVVRYVGCVDAEAGRAEVVLKTYPAAHPFAQLSGSDNLIVFTTERYKDRPVCVRGPGAGAEVTAAGVFADLIKVIRSHPRG
ncbi:hypothetical protein GPECTOR_29g1 [Gonium pectorale]|uniref:Homoserine dehydrogenase n=1 Tax=Gonium pectorale TaxID=33097 RepID=A0A150GEA6_GONPE|nr:hypothetical protein GPECTOR_29g1 [Gonium pectorale]|eukprot:KXZ48191.1 hypothetical protein GPECTOR_29g1 [Gonium pectorale]